MKKNKIFISGVQKELREERFAVRDLITRNRLLKDYFNVFLFEDLPAKSMSSEAVYLKEVSKSDILLLLLGKEYGQMGSDDLSATEREFRKAVKLRRTVKQNLEILVFIKEIGDSNRDKRVSNLIREIEKPDSGYVYKKFNEITDLKECVFNSLVEILDEKGILAKLPFDSTICDEATYENVSEELVRDFLRNRAIKQRVDVPETSIKDFLLKTIKVVKKVDGVLKPTNAALLFFCDYPQEFISQSSVKIARFRGNNRREFIDSQELMGSLYQILDDVEKFFKRNTRLASKIVEFKRVDIPEYPFQAVREAMINAVAHRDYNRFGSNVQIDIFDDRVEVTNPGGLLPGLDLKNLEGVHETRNKKICEIFHETKDMEKYGTGMFKMKEWMTDYGLKPPALNQPGNFFRATFYGPGEKILDLVSSVPEERQTDLRELGLNERQIEVLRLMLNEGEKMKIKLYANLFNISDKTAKRDMKKLLKTGFVVKIGYKKGAYFEAR